MNEKDFDQVVKHFRLGERAQNIAREVLVEGYPVFRVAKERGVTRQYVQRLASKLREKHRELTEKAS